MPTDDVAGTLLLVFIAVLVSWMAPERCLMPSERDPTLAASVEREEHGKAGNKP